jgi:hypothetical protein
LEENKNKRPENFRGRNAEHSHAMISDCSREDNNGPEFLMCAFVMTRKKEVLLRIIQYMPSKTSKKKKIILWWNTKRKKVRAVSSRLKILDTPLRMNLWLLDLNVWIADNGATVHATQNPSDIVKKSEKKCNDSGKVGNGKSESTEWYDDFHVIVCDMEGNVKVENDSCGICANFKV